MIEKIAIILIVALSQLNIIPESQSSFNFLDQFSKEETTNIQLNLQEGNWVYPVYPAKIKGASDFNIDAKSALVLDVKTNAVLYSKNSNENLPIASITKIMTGLVVLDNIDLDEVVTISRKAFDRGGSKNGLSVGEKITAGNLLKVMFVNSNNIAAYALAEHTSGNVDDFVRLMNKKADSIGLENTEFLNPSGLDSENGNNVSTAYEVARLVNYSLKESLIWEILRIQKITVTSTNEKIKHNLKNTNLLLGKLKNITGGKTGLTNNAGQCLVLAVGDPENNHKIISVVLDSGDRFLETKKLTNWIFENYKW